MNCGGSRNRVAWGTSLIKDPAREAIPDQNAAASESTARIADMLEAGWEVVVIHGNGPQVVFILRHAEPSP